MSEVLTMDAVEVLRDIQSHEVLISNQPQAFPEAASDSDYFRQGDVYVWRRDVLPKGLQKVKVRLQLAPGTSKGSRHCLDSSDGVTMYHDPNGDALQGPWFVVTKPLSIPHPEHGRVIMCPGIFEVTYARTRSNDLKRIRD